MDENPYKASVEAGPAQQATEKPLPPRFAIRIAVAIPLLLMAALCACRPDLGVKPWALSEVDSLADCQRLGWNLVAIYAALHHCFRVACFAITAWGIACANRRILAIGALFGLAQMAIALTFDFSFWSMMNR